jgi:urease accessory protein
MKSMVRYGLSNGFGSIFCTLATVALASGLYAQPALAHHPLGGRLPANAFEGLMSGLAHPILGFDHFLFVLAIALLALRVSVGLWLPVAFVLGGLGGAIFHVSSGLLPWGEVGVTLSLALAGFFLAREQAPQSGAMVIMGAIAGLFHGYAFGEAIFGAEMSPLWSYLLGLTVIQLGVAATVYGVAKLVSDRLGQNPLTLLRYAGFTFLGTGLAFLSGVVLG